MIEALAAARFVHLAALCLLLGSYVFVGAIARPVWASASKIPKSPAARRFEDYVLSLHQRLAIAALSLVLLSACIGLALQAAAVSRGGDAGIGALLTDTRYGLVWLARMFLALLLGVLLVARVQRPFSRSRFRLEALIAGALAAALALSGHAAAGEGWEFLLQVGADALHLLAAGAWLGSLLPLGFAIRFATIELKSHSITALMVARYSRLGVLCVTTLLITGLVNAWQLVDGVPNLLGTPYGQLLLVKLSLIAPLLAIAWVNLRRLNPAIGSLEAVLRSGAQDPASALALARNALIEIALGIAILLVVALLGVTPPARHAQPEWPFSFRLDWGVLDASAKARGEFELAMMWLLFGALALELAWLVKKVRIPAALAGVALSGYGIYSAIAVVNTDAYPSTYRRPVVPYQSISVANGAALYVSHCGSCHGDAGRGDGPASAGLNPRPADLTGRHVDAHTAGDLYWWISHGKTGTAMMGFAAKLSEEERWDAVNFVRALAGGKKSRSLAPVIDDKTLIAAPDFSYVDSRGAARALREARGEKVVLLVLLGGSESSDLAARLRASHAALNEAGLEVIVVPRVTHSARDGGILTWVVEGNAEIHTTYALFTQSFSDDGVPTAARHSEFLIDKQGYLRARWLPHENPAWLDPAVLVKQAVQLRDEPPRAPMPLEHVH